MVGVGRPYLPHEEKQIVEYIFDHQGCARLKGNTFWKEMEPHMTNRTWQSLKEHFRKKIYPKINFPRFGLTREQINEIQMCYDTKRKINQNETDQPHALPDFYDEDNM